MTQVIAETPPTGQPPVTERPDISLSVCNIGKNADFRAVFLEGRLYLCGFSEMKKAGHQHIYGCLAGPIRTK